MTKPIDPVQLCCATESAVNLLLMFSDPDNPRPFPWRRATGQPLVMDIDCGGVHVYFDLDEPVIKRLRDAIREVMEEGAARAEQQREEDESDG
jgi:hypothetical protein